MNKIFKIGLFVIALISAINVSAQKSKTFFGIRGGINFSDYSGDGVTNNNTKLGYNIGLTIDHALSENLYIMSALEFTTKGTVHEQTLNNGQGVDYLEKIVKNALYFQVPIHVGYKLPVADDTKIVFHAGPYVAYAISGRFKESFTSGEEEVVNEETDLFREDRYKKSDYGIGGGIGIEYKRTSLLLGYDLGLANINRFAPKVKNKNASLSLAYRF